MEKTDDDLFKYLVLAVKDYAIFALDMDGNVVSWNEGAQRIKGYTAEEIIGKHFSIFYTEQSKRVNHPDFELEQALKNGSFEEEGWRVKKDGSQFWARVTITPIPGERGFAKVTRDLTQQRQYEFDLKRARDEAIRANQLKTEFMANITHEIRTPLSGVIGMAELLALDPYSQDTPDLADRIYSSSKALLVTLNDLLDFSKLEAGKMLIEKAAFSPENLIDDVMSLVRPAAIAKGLKITAEVVDIPECLVGDQNKIQQVLLNFVHNAVKFTEKGTVRVLVTVEDSTDSNVTINFSVSDTGIGINPIAKEKLFQPFVQADGSTSRRFGGTGLGLSIAKQLIGLMNGKTGVTSEEGVGSTFWFTVTLEKCA